MSETLVTLQEHDGILTVVMDAPKNNLMTGAFHDALDAVLEQVQNRAVQGGIKAMIVCGGGRHFSVGADVDSLKTVLPMNFMTTPQESSRRVTLSGNAVSPFCGNCRFR